MFQIILRCFLNVTTILFLPKRDRGWDRDRDRDRGRGAGAGVGKDSIDS